MVRQLREGVVCLCAKAEVDIVATKGCVPFTNASADDLAFWIAELRVTSNSLAQ